MIASNIDILIISIHFRYISRIFQKNDIANCVLKYKGVRWMVNSPYVVPSEMFISLLLRNIYYINLFLLTFLLTVVKVIFLEKILLLFYKWNSLETFCRGHKHRSSQEKLTVHEEDHPSTPPPMSSPHPKSSTCYLHKAMPAGILLLELSFREQYFCVEMFVCENTRLGIPVNKHVCISII